MTPAARVATSIEILTAIASTDQPADRVVSSQLRFRRFMGSRDRNVVANQVFRVLRHRSRYDWWLGQAQLPPMPRGWVIIDQAVHAPTLFNSSFTGGRYGARPLNGAEAHMALAVINSGLTPKEMPWYVRLEVPEWAAAELARSLGDRVEDEMEAMLHQAPLDLRANTLMIERDAAIAALAEEGVMGQPTKYSPLGIRVEGRPPLGSIHAFRDGMVEVQDEGSQLLAALVGAKAGMHVLDLCAGAGGKSLALSAMMGNRGRVSACDIYEAKLERARERMRRAGVQNARCRAISGTSDPWLKRHKWDFDRVLVDAPCSGTGTWRRNPDARWARKGTNLDEINEIQKSLLHRGSSLVVPGGRVVYGTCSILMRENEDIVAEFLDIHPDFFLVPASSVLPDVATGDFLKLSPALHDTDGFFGAVMERRDDFEEIEEAA
jgi:16S rRNA (cytosine967-C5)-methyltransferase